MSGSAAASPAMMSPLLQRVFSSDQMAVRAALAEVNRQLAAVEVDEDTRSTVEIVLAEVLNNVVEHAYQEDPNGTIDLSVLMAKTDGYDELLIELSDMGVPMPGGQLPRGKPPVIDTDFNDLPEGGFGWNLIHRMTHDLHYERLSDRNHLSFRLRVLPTV